MSTRICVHGSLEDNCHPCFHGACTLVKETDNKSSTKGDCEGRDMSKKKLFKAEEEMGMMGREVD